MRQEEVAARLVHKQTLTHQTVSGFLWQSSVAAANLIIRAAVLIILARKLTAEDFGIVAAAFVVAKVTEVITQLGVTKAMVQRLTLTDEHVRSGFTMSVYISIAAAGLLLVAAPLFALMFRMPGLAPVVRFFSLLLLLNGIAAVPMALLQRWRRFKAFSVIELVSFSVGYGAVGLLLTFAGFGVWALAIAQVGQALIRTILFLQATRPPIGLWPRRDAVRDVFRDGTGYSSGEIGNLVAMQVDYFIVGRLLGAEPLGLYNRAYQLLMLPAQLLGTASQRVLFPSIASIQDQPERVARVFLRATGVIAMTTLPLSGVLVILAPELVDATLGVRWRGMVVPFQILVTTLMFRTSYKIADSISMAIGSMYDRALRQWIYAGAVAAGALIGARWAVPGVSAGVGAAVVLNFLMMIQLAMRLTGVPAFRLLAVHLRHALAAVPPVLGTALMAGVARNHAASDALVLGLGAATATLIFLLMWWQFRWIFGEDAKWAHSLATARFSTSSADS